jgi:hypothetical protein
VNTFREQVRDIFTQTLGNPAVIPVGNGDIWRWVLQRQYSMHVYVTIDSPEMPDLAHVIVSDPASKNVEPVASYTVRTHEEADRIVQAIVKQWKHASEA